MGDASRPVLRTARLTLVPVGPGDVPDLVHHYRHPDIRRFLWDDVEVDRETVAEAVRSADEAPPGLGLWVIRENAEGPLLGSCGVRTNGEEVEIVVSLHPGWWGQGRAAEAAEAVLSHAAAHGVREVVGYADEGNDASVRLLRRLGGTGGPHRWVLVA